MYDMSCVVRNCAALCTKYTPVFATSGPQVVATFLAMGRGNVDDPEVKLLASILSLDFRRLVLLLSAPS